MKLGIVGHGFVGTAVDHGFTRDVQKFIVDPKHNSTNTIEDLIAFRPDATFVAVPTPQLETGECNTAILEEVMQKLNQSKGLLVIVKSTVPSYKLEQIKCMNLLREVLLHIGNISLLRNLIYLPGKSMIGLKILLK